MNGSGQCLCGAVTFTAEGVESHVHVCHCSMCRRWNGGPGMAVAVDLVVFTGEGILKDTVRRSGPSAALVRPVAAISSIC